MKMCIRDSFASVNCCVSPDTFPASSSGISVSGSSPLEVSAYAVSALCPPAANPADEKVITATTAVPVIRMAALRYKRLVIFTIGVKMC